MITDNHHDTGMESSDEIESFVRQTLGCGCPPEVFEHIECQTGMEIADIHHRDKVISIDLKLNIGNRLLVHVVETNDARFIRENLSCLVNAGRTERDESGFNRFRLVLAVDDSIGCSLEETDEIAGELFRSLAGMDDRIHLHVVRKSEIEPL